MFLAGTIENAIVYNYFEPALRNHTAIYTKTARNTIATVSLDIPYLVYDKLGPPLEFTTFCEAQNVVSHTWKHAEDNGG